jgi:dienelactone hydrolase
MNVRNVLLLCALLSLLPTALGAQSFEARVRSAASQAPDLKFPDEAKELSFFSPLSMAIYKPSGDGPFPALVIVHTCGGLRLEIRDWTKLALGQGYVVFVMDSLGPRGLKTVCYPPTPVNPVRGAKDAFQALEHLKKFSFVDPQRIGLIGFSWGAMVGLLVSSKAYADVFSPGNRFHSVASLYPGCYFSAKGQLREFEYLRPDTDQPLLVLMGELDTETPPADCLPRLQALKEKGAPVEWHLYPKTTHCWDCKSLDNFSKTDARGNHVVYRYSKETTQDSSRRAFEFFSKPLKSGK